jgi:predicted membrane protein
MDNHSVTNRRLLFGIFLITVGLFWILVRLDLIPDVWTNILISWQMLLIGIGVFSLIGGNRTAGIILILIGGFFLIDEVVIIPYSIRQIGWPLLIIGVGLAMIFTHRSRQVQPPKFEMADKGTEYFDDFVIFGGREIVINTKSFLGGKITSIFGGAEYDFRHTSLSENGAIIDCVCVFGGSSFRVPPDWNIKNEISTVFGAFTDKRGLSVHGIYPDPSKTLILRGFSAFGGVEVKY